MPFRLTAGLFVLLIACGKNADAIPPGDWTGRCKTTKAATATTVPTVRLTPALKSGAWIDDGAEMLDGPFEAEMTRSLSAFHAQTCHQLIVVTVRSLEGRSIEEYALSLVNGIGLGHGRFNNGLLLLLARGEGRLRIEVGCGLEDVISDQQAADIVAKQLVPQLRAGDASAAVRDAMTALMALARTKVIPDAYRPTNCSRSP
jgi:uncharacterized protein